MSYLAAIYPETAAILGYCRGEAIYSRDCVHLVSFLFLFLFHICFFSCVDLFCFVCFDFVLLFVFVFFFGGGGEGRSGVRRVFGAFQNVENPERTFTYTQWYSK